MDGLQVEMPADFFREIYKAFYVSIHCTQRATIKRRSVKMQRKTLREVCNMVGVTRRAVQGYEKIGLVASSGKNKYGYLLYDEKAVEKIRTIKQYQEFGFMVKEIKELLEVSEEVYVEMMNVKMNVMKQKFMELEANISRMEELLSEKKR